MNKGKEPSPFWRIGRPVLWGALVGGAVTALLLVLMAVGMTVKDVPQALVAPLATAAAAIGAFVGGLTAARLAGRQGLLLGALCGLLLYALILLTELSNIGDMQAASVLIKWAILIACGAVGGIVGVNLRRRPRG